MSELRRLINELKLTGLRKTSADKARAVRLGKMRLGLDKNKNTPSGDVTPAQQNQRKKAAQSSAKRRKGRKVTKRRLIFSR